MNILHINTFAKIGGAARAVSRLHAGLRHLGQNSHMFVAERSSSGSTVTVFAPPRIGLLRRLFRLVRRERIERGFARYQASRPAGYDSFSDDRTHHGATLLSQLPSCDVINLHWIASFVDYQSFFDQVPKRIPTIWTLHDMNAFTGGCHYDHGCGRFTVGCGLCPQLGSRDQVDLSKQIWERKVGIYNKIAPERMRIVTPSRWLASEVERSRLFRRFPVSVIPNGVDTDVFSPQDRVVARAALQVPQDTNVILFVADAVDVKRKGFVLLAEALAGLSDFPRLFLISLGSGEPTVDASIPHLHLGHLGNDRLLALVYSAADLFVISSIQDNLPNTVLESLACGTPVVGFRVGGIPDMVRSGLTGLSAPPEDVSALCAAIMHLIQNPAELAIMRDKCRSVAMAEYTLEMQARRYVQLYERAVASIEGRSHA